jgi:Protein kinase domain
LIHPEGNPVLLKMKSVTNTLHLTNEDLQALEENPKEALTLLNKKADELSPPLPKNPSVAEKKFNVTISESPLSDSSLMKMVQAFSVIEQRIEKLQLNQKIDFTPKLDSTPKPIKIFDKRDIDSFPALSRSSKKSQVKIIWIGEQLGKGSFSTVHEAISQTTSQVFALKQIKNDPEALEEVSNELKLLAMIHQKGPAWGIKENATKVIQIRNADQSIQAGNLSVKYDLDFFSYIVNLQKKPALKNDLPARLCEIHQLLSALKQIHALNILHSDIKPENILVKKGPNNQTHIHLADFGGARFISEDMSLHTIVNLRTVRSSHYSPELDDYHLSLYFKRGEKEMFFLQEQKMDVFAMGTTIFMLLATSMPFNYTKHPELTKNNRPIINDNIDFSNSFKHLPSELLIFVKNMLKEKASDRPSADEAFFLFDLYLETRYPETHQLIQQRMKDGGYQPV